MLEGKPTTKAADEDAPHFLLRMVHKYPHEVTIYEGGPMTNLALAISIDPEFPRLAKELVFMGGGFSPRSDNPEFLNSPRHEFNFWFDPEAAAIVLRAPWNKIVCTSTDVSVKVKMTPDLIKQIEAAGTPITRYLSKFVMLAPGADIMWDELAAAAWLDPSMITKADTRYMSADIGHGATYGNTLSWPQNAGPAPETQKVEIQLDVDTQKFYRMFLQLMTGPTPPRS